MTGSIGLVSTGVDLGTGDVTLYVTGSPAGSASIFVQDEGILKGSPSIFNFVGIPVDVSVSGTVARIFVTGTDVGTAIANAPTSSIQSTDKIPFVSGTQLRTITYGELFDGIADTLTPIYTDIFMPINGWNLDSNTWTCRSIDTPIYNVSVDANVTGTIGIGNRIWLQQSNINKFFLVHGVHITGSTTYLNLYGGTDYTIITGSLTLPQCSQIKAPIGFPVDPDKWTVQVEDTTLRQQASPTANVWYNNGSISINVPIGKWFASYEAEVQSENLPPTGTFISNYCTLSTANNSETDKKWTTVLYRVDGNTAGLQVFGSVTRSNEIVAPVKTTYYLNQKTDQPLTANIYFRGDLATIVLRARSGYL